MSLSTPVVCRSDPKEAERKKLAALITDSASKRQTVTGGQGPQIYVLDLQVGLHDMNFHGGVC